MRTEYAPDGTTYVYTDDENTRYAVWKDNDAEDPREWDDETETHIYNTANRYDTDTPSNWWDAKAPTMRAFLRRYEDTGDDTDALTFATRYAKIFETGEEIDVASVSGHSQSNWWEIVTVATGGRYASNALDVMGEWLRGDVYAVQREHATECEHGEVHWGFHNDQGLESIPVGGIYASSPEDAVTEYDAIA